MCEEGFLRRTAFSYLEELASQFYAEYGNKIHTVARPYSFIEFGKYFLPRLSFNWHSVSVNRFSIGTVLQGTGPKWVMVLNSTII